MLSIKDLHASIDEKSILRGLNLDVKPGEVHAIMGPNGAGKSTLSQVLAGRENYNVTKGTVDWDGQDSWRFQRILPARGCQCGAAPPRAARA
jgi:Fe-S cluster assembly ATP-binding protein